MIMRNYMAMKLAVLICLTAAIPLSAQQDNGSGVGDSAGIGELDTGSALEQNQNFQAENRELGIVGGNNAGGFVGQAGADNAGGGSSFGPGAGSGGFGSFFNSFNQQFNQQSQNSDRSIRVPMRLGFVQVRPVPQERSQRVVRQLDKLPPSIFATPITVVVEGKTAVLQGVVRTDHSKAIAERLALLEPGIYRVRNELTVQPESEQEALPSPLAPLPIPR